MSTRTVHLPLTPGKTQLAFFLSALILTAASIFIVMQGAAYEPYYAFNLYDAFTQVVIGTLLILAWSALALAIPILTWKRLLHPLVLLLLPWAAICLYYLSCSPLGYFNDLRRFTP
jgi:hypothetical protein